MDPLQQRIQQTTTQVCEVLAQHMDDFERNAARYAHEYVRAQITGKGPVQAHGLHPAVAKLVREVVLDELVLPPSMRSAA
jgi:hypothetical protein